MKIKKKADNLFVLLLTNEDVNILKKSNELASSMISDGEFRVRTSFTKFETKKFIERIEFECSNSELITEIEVDLDGLIVINQIFNEVSHCLHIPDFDNKIGATKEFISKKLDYIHKLIEGK
jgi:hypothetical protein